MKTEVYFYYSNLSNIKDVFEIKKLFQENAVVYNVMYYKNELRDGLVDSLNATHYNYFLENSLPLLTKPMNWVMCYYYNTETTQYEMSLGKENIIQAFS